MNLSAKKKLAELTGVANGLFLTLVPFSDDFTCFNGRRNPIQQLEFLFDIGREGYRESIVRARVAAWVELVVGEQQQWIFHPAVLPQSGRPVSRGGEQQRVRRGGR